MPTINLRLPIPPPHFHFLLAAQGWMELGDDPSAWEELSKLPEGYRWHPDASDLRWHLHSRKGDWEECLRISQRMIEEIPERVNGWIHRSFALHELHRTQEALDQLAQALDRFPKVWTIPYNLACYCAQMGHLEEARQWFGRALALDRESAVASASDDSDLEPIRQWIVTISSGAGKSGP